MADGTGIEWTDATWNPITGCSVVSPGCTNCYAMKLAGTRLAHHPSREGLTIDTKAGPVWNGVVRFNEQWLTQPLQWKRPRMIFVCAHGDLFHENVPHEWIDKVFAVMALAPQHVFQVLTKRSKRMREYIEGVEQARFMDGLVALGEKHKALPDAGMRIEWPLPNVWAGVSTEDQTRADERIPDLLATPAAVRWVSYEPAIGPITFRWAKWDDWRDGAGAPRPSVGELDGLRGINWLVCGGESGPGARPMHPDWARSARDQCAAAGVAFFFKQWGEWAPHIGAVDGWNINDDPEISRFDHREWDEERHNWGEPFRPMWCEDMEEAHVVSRIGKKAAGRLLDGIEHNGMPGDYTHFTPLDLPEAP